MPIAAGFAFDSPSTALFAGVGALAALFTDPRRGFASRLVFIAFGAAHALASDRPLGAVVTALTIAAAAFIPWGLARGQFHRSLAITLFVLLLFDVGMIADGGDAPLISARLWDTLIGAGAVAMASAMLQLWRGTRSGTAEGPPVRAPAAEADGAGRPAEPGEPSGPG